MLQAPLAFEGSLADLYGYHLQHVLPNADEVAQIHEWMGLYCHEEEPIFPVRAVTGAERRRTYSTRDGTKIAPADNSPAWALHSLMMENRLSSYPSFRDLMRTMPTHMFDIAKLRCQTANSRGWYVAHIFPAKNRDIQFQRWDRKEVKRRFYLTLHPCNLFFVPGVRNRGLGEDVHVIRYIANQYATRYVATWPKFLSRVHVSFERGSDGVGNFMNVRLDTSVFTPSSSGLKSPVSGRLNAGHVKASYRASRLTFKRDLIEPLASDDSFEVITPMGTYRFTKGEFYSAFPRIRHTKSYRENGIYHGETLHFRAHRFRVSTDGQVG